MDIIVEEDHTYFDGNGVVVTHLKQGITIDGKDNVKSSFLFECIDAGDLRIIIAPIESVVTGVAIQQRSAWDLSYYLQFLTNSTYTSCVSRMAFYII